ncbi:hypothetical protein B296_00034971 [Ensete ventricosum]|uniref:Uncharacterized protein n=1 Tax=Ensete ventricosum TaxID=4639 RepID=A0A426YAZ7_ENSVE|nr:hypothetical protein B296_00034971 [Ensete ventricosum]
MRRMKSRRRCLPESKPANDLATPSVRCSTAPERGLSCVRRGSRGGRAETAESMEVNIGRCVHNMFVNFRLKEPLAPPVDINRRDR